MIRVASIPDDLTPLERFALALLLDGSGLLQVTDPSASVVELVVTACAERKDAGSDQGCKLRGASQDASLWVL